MSVGRTTADLFDRIRVQGNVALRGLTDAEYFWEPVAGCWTVHQRTEPARGAVSLGSGQWVHDYSLDDPDPPPFTTIAWRLTHIAVGTGVLCDVAFDGVDSSPFTAEFPGSAEAAVDLWHANFERLYAAARSAEERLMEIVPCPWGGPEPAWKQLNGQVVEHLHHLGEIALLRHLYRAQVG